MALSDDIGSLRDRVLADLTAAHDYYTDTKTAWLAAIRHSVHHGRPYGANDWVKQTARALGLESTLRGRGSSGRME